MQRQYVGLREQRVLAGGKSVAGLLRTLARQRLSPCEHIHSEAGTGLRHQRADRPEPKNPQRTAAQAMGERVWPFAAAHPFRLDTMLRRAASIRATVNSAGEVGELLLPVDTITPNSVHGGVIDRRWRCGRQGRSARRFGRRSTSAREKVTRSRIATTTSAGRKRSTSSSNDAAGSR